MLYNFWDSGRENDNRDLSDLQMSFKVIKSGTKRKLDFLVSFAVSLTVSEIVLMLRTTFLPTPLVFGHAVGIWRHKTRMMGLQYSEEIMIVDQTTWTQSTSVIDRQTDRRTDRRTR